MQALISFVALYFFAALRAYPSINGILLQKMALTHGKISINNLYKEFTKIHLDKNQIPQKQFDFKNNIEFKDVSFNYPDRNNLNKNKY